MLLRSSDKFRLFVSDKTLSVFKGTTWSHIWDHVHFYTGYNTPNCLKLRYYPLQTQVRVDVAMKHMFESVACKRS